MPRIRTVKPDLFKHEELFDAERATELPLRLAFIGLFTVADREGRFAWRPRRLKADCLPYDDFDFADILNGLAKYGFIEKYEIDGEEYGYIPNWTKHQVINQRESKSIIPNPTHVHAHASTSANITGNLRRDVFTRDGFKCLRCGLTDDLTVDHIFPRCIGGTNAITNLRTLCRPCNSARPVAGQALIDDLAADGFTMEDKQRMCTHVHAPVMHVGKGKEGKGLEEKDSQEEVVLDSDSELRRLRVA